MKYQKVTNTLENTRWMVTYFLQVLRNLKYSFFICVFQEFCESIKRYLSYYRVAVLAISEKSNLTSIRAVVKRLLPHISCLASICKVGPYKESKNLPNGVALLNYLYQNILSVFNKDVLMVLFSVLYPCCQVYFRYFKYKM